MKIAVYVEGQTELIFVCEILRKWYDNNPAKVGIRYWNLSGVNPIKKDLTFGGVDSERFYVIVNAGNDVKTLAEALKRTASHKENGFDRVLVLRDMFSKAYDDYNPLIPRNIDASLNQAFIDGAQRAIDEKGYDGFLKCHFAIMELEAWFLGMGWYLQRENSMLTPAYLLSSLRFDLSKDPETTIYHPANRLKKIYKHIGLRYRKREDEVNKIMSYLNKADFEGLIICGKCKSFREFIQNLTE